MSHILIADDEEILRMLIVDTLEDLGHDIEEAEDGSEALEKLQEQSFDLVVLDHMMPERTGLEVLQSLPDHIKEETLIIMLTAKAQDADREAALQAGARYFVAKPFSPAELEALVKDVL
ncbi:response regulator receiver domain-containing protein [Salsuginibacillus halophilus]|uniref:Response regulator receiver domain-containing protein n=1 Tax=Salsuginibacillus halophilus TaxID=517424 RepID=A0A2P8H857_9BACI|nr:response regulator [Salsuginibacillus halophilus]PSL42415.1 response regulator receiver domain-containing protein [Salsuginibacillus halophilus]